MSASARTRALVDRAAAAGLFTDRVHGRALTVTAVVRGAAGLLFLLSVVPKITAHQREVDMFGQFGLPRSGALVDVVIAAEVTCGLLLLLGLFTRLAAASMAGNMLGAILTAGTHVGGPIHLGLAPALLATMLYLLWAGPGRPATDRRWQSPSATSRRPAVSAAGPELPTRAGQTPRQR